MVAQLQKITNKIHMIWETLKILLSTLETTRHNWIDYYTAAHF